jgi:hypothetical protein
LNSTGIQLCGVVGQLLVAAGAGTSGGGLGVLVAKSDSAKWVVALMSVRLTALNGC